MPNKNAPGGTNYRGWFLDQLNSQLEAYHDSTVFLRASTAGAVTLPSGGLTISSGGLTITAGGITMNGGDLLARGGNAPIFQLTTTDITTAGNETLSAAQILGGRITRDPNGGGRTDTTDTAANIVGAITDAAVGDSFDLVLENTADAAEVITLAGGSGVTLETVGATADNTIGQDESRIIRFVLTNVTASSEAVSAYVIST